MLEFDYMKFVTAAWDSDIVSGIGQIHEYKGRQDFYLQQKPHELTRLIEVAKIQSTESSNKIEGILTTSTRIRQLLAEKTSPRNRDESEILGYRDVLNTIHENYEYIPVRPSFILQLHRDLYKYSFSSTGGKFKSVQNYINAKATDGSEFVLFTPLAPSETPRAIESICLNYNQLAGTGKLDDLILVAIFICDFLCVHPFLDGNGRMSRLLTTLLLYRSGYQIGKYISLEKLVEQTKVGYYDALQKISRNWHTGSNDYRPFIKYLLKIILRAYRELDERIELVEENLPAYEMVKTVVEKMLGSFSKKAILERCPSIGSSSVEMALKKLKDEQVIKTIGAGRNTRYVRR